MESPPSLLGLVFGSAGKAALCPERAWDSHWLCGFLERRPVMWLEMKVAGSEPVLPMSHGQDIASHGPAGGWRVRSLRP